MPQITTYAFWRGLCKLKTMRNLPMRFLAMAAALLLAAPLAGRAAEGSLDPAARPIETFYAALVDTMKHGQQLGLQGRFRQLTTVVDEAFNIPAMAQLSVGPSWASVSEVDKNAIIGAFERMTVAGYAKNFAKFEGEQFAVDPVVKARNEDKIVETKLIGGDHSIIPFNYRMRLTDGKWKIVDVYLNGYVSQLALRRADFSSTIASSGPSGLVKKINELVDKQMTGG